MTARVFPALLLTVMLAGCSAVRDARRKGSADPAAEARLGEAFTGKSYGVAGLLCTVERRSVFPQDTAAYLYLHILDARAGETLVACALHRAGKHVKTLRRCRRSRRRPANTAPAAGRASSLFRPGYCLFPVPGLYCSPQRPCCRLPGSGEKFFQTMQTLTDTVRSCR